MKPLFTLLLIALSLSACSSNEVMQDPSPQAQQQSAERELNKL
ncbi:MULTISPECIES: hypothetical protein [unclassified Marinobacterium]|jgi:uncharacterized protein YcfL|nr:MULTISPECIES: hypothetical protein [unclassified Marinobacterium]NRP57408.1 hypothetical protein [Marinobacterium sp. xm-d-510]NRP97920.1 hypothetical protein [Marinobacterium sp. xm-a-127]NRP10194.1 hypothetical protein [Marinobacterium sp. xm-g-48]NRP15565.1 hypothetical protein [Marinobacterium sp. xm-a-152]NRP37084.1 hypothetical protein [Marinobacterium sp. xm-d-579]